MSVFRAKIWIYVNFLNFAFHYQFQICLSKEESVHTDSHSHPQDYGTGKCFLSHW